MPPGSGTVISRSPTKGLGLKSKTIQPSSMSGSYASRSPSPSRHSRSATPSVGSEPGASFGLVRPLSDLPQVARAAEAARHSDSDNYTEVSLY